MERIGTIFFGKDKFLHVRKKATELAI